jgi:serine O-acetyltransferase
VREVCVSARQRFHADIARYFSLYPAPPSAYRRMRTVMETEAIWAICVYRWGQHLEQEANGFVRLLFKFPYQFISKWVGIVTGIHLFPETTIGPGFYIGHYGGIWISPLATLGANCNVGPNVVIGVAGKGRTKGPTLGDRVWIGPGAVITGEIKVGAGCVVAANSFVTGNFPENAVLIGVPARVLSYTGSANLIQLPE